jgi:hypothetical protein
MPGGVSCARIAGGPLEACPSDGRLGAGTVAATCDRGLVMLAEIGFVPAMVAVVVAVGRAARWTGLPDAVLLTVVVLV